MKRSKSKSLTLLGCTFVLAAFSGATQADDFTLGNVLTDAKLYFTAPIRWDESDWMFFGGSIAAIAVAHDFDSRVRDHFAPAEGAAATSSDPHSLRDAIPAASVVAGTWLISEVTDDSWANTEAYSMVEAAGFSSITAEAFKYAAGRERPDETNQVNAWRDGGSSFP